MTPNLKKIGIFSLLLLSTTVNAMPTKECTFLNEDQKQVVTRAYQLGEDSDYGMTLAAIALTESTAGERLVNNVSGDYGVFQNNLKNTVRMIEQRTGSRMSYRQIQGLKKNLIANMDESGMYAQMNIEFWEQVHGKEAWSKIVASYNAGYNYSGSKGQTYLAEVKNNLRKLRNCNCIER